MSGALPAPSSSWVTAPDGAVRPAGAPPAPTGHAPRALSCRWCRVRFVGFPNRRFCSDVCRKHLARAEGRAV